MCYSAWLCMENMCRNANYMTLCFLGKESMLLVDSTQMIVNFK
jgi:hypothetical protein